MNYEQLMYAVELASHKTIQETADSLHISKSGLSQSISQLEKELGVTLFSRSHHGTQLTDSGRKMLPYLKDTMIANARLQNKANSLGSLKRQQILKIAYANTLLKPMITEYLKMQDNSYFLSIDCQSSTQIINKIRQHTLDAGFIAIDADHEDQLQGLSFKVVHEGHISLITSHQNLLIKKQKLTLQDLKKQVFALYNDPFNDQLFEHLQYLCGPLKKIARVEDAWAMSKIIETTNAVCLARDWQARHSTDSLFSSLPKINIGNLINDRFKLGWVTNPHYPLASFTRNYLHNVTKLLSK